MHTGDERIAATARRWVAAKRLAKKLRGARREVYCERGEGLPFGEEPKQSAPCWKHYTPDYDGEGVLMAKEKWCASCLKREEIHLRYRETTKARGALERALTVLARDAAGQGERGEG